MMKQITLKLKELDSKCKNGILEVSIIDPSLPLILIIPGGAYSHLSISESKPVRDKFLSFNYNSAILYYSVFPFSFPTQIDELTVVFNYLKKTFNNVFIMGFSAGGHLAGLFASAKYGSLIKGLILCYPVISFEKYVHINSRVNFLGSKDSVENYHYYSINNRVNDNYPPVFLWTCKCDESVPYENSLLMQDALKKHNIYHEFYLFNSGRHGIALADSSAIKNNDLSYVNNEVAIWPNLVDNFIKKVVVK